MTMLEKLEKNDFDLETMKEVAALAFRDLLNENGVVDEIRLADVESEIFTDEVEAELSAELDEILDDGDMESVEGMADVACASVKVVINKVVDYWFRGKFIEALKTEVE